MEKKCKLDYNINLSISRRKIKEKINRERAGTVTYLFLLSAILSVVHLLSPETSIPLVLWGAANIIGVVTAMRRGWIRSKPFMAISGVLLLAGFLFSVGIHLYSPRTDEEWSAGYLSVVEDLREKINGSMSRHLEGRIQLVETVEEAIRAARATGELRRGGLFEILESIRARQAHGEDLFLLLREDPGNDTAWSGENYLPEEYRIPEGRSDGEVTVDLFRGTVVTAAILTRPLEGIGRLVLVDHLEFRHHLTRRYARGDRFLDRLRSRTGVDVSIHPVREGTFRAELTGRLIFPLIFRGEHLADWSVETVTREGYRARLRSLENRVLPLLLILPWILAAGILKERLGRFFRIQKGDRRLGFLEYGLAFGGLLLAARIVLVEVGFPSLLVGGSFFSPRYFATGLFENGSVSVGEFFISGLFIFLFLIHLLPWVKTGGKGTGAWIISIIAMAGSLFLSLAAPFVLDRLLRDSLLSLVIEQDYVQSILTVFWELGLYLLLLSLVLVIILPWRWVIHRAGLSRRAIPSFALIIVGLFGSVIFMAHYRFGEEWRLVFRVLMGAMIFAGGGLIAAIGLREERRGRPFFEFGAVSILLLALLSSAVLYPGILRYRNRALEETGEELLEQLGAPYENFVSFILEDIVQELLDQKDDLLSASVDRSGLGFYAWVNTRLSGLSQRSSLVITGEDGEEISRFSLTDFEPDTTLSDFFLRRSAESDEPFIYHGFSNGSEFYSAVVPYWEDDSLRSVLTVTLPTDLEERLGGGPIKLFLDESEGDRLSLPSSMHLNVRAVEEGEVTRSDGGWKTEFDESGSVRRLQRRIEFGGVDRFVEIEFQLQGMGVTLARINFLFLVHVFFSPF
jgi:hypothetical protein